MFDNLSTFLNLLDFLMASPHTFNRIIPIDHRIPHDGPVYPQLYWNTTLEDVDSFSAIRAVLQKNNICCVGLINLLRLIVVKTPVPVNPLILGHNYRGLKGWMPFFERNACLRAINYSQLQVGDLLIREHNPLKNDSGHVALIYKIETPAIDPSDFTLIHASFSYRASGIQLVNWKNFIDEEKQPMNYANNLLEKLASNPELPPETRLEIKEQQEMLPILTENIFHYSVSISNWLNPHLR